MSSGTAVASGFEFLNFGGVPLSGASATLVSVIDNSGSTTNRANEFSLLSISSTEWELRTNALFYYGANAGTNESYTFTFDVTFGTTTTTLTETGNLENIDPTINNSNATPIQLEIGDQSVLPNLSGVNGSADPTRDTLGLTFSIDSSTGAGAYVVVNNNEVQNTNTSASGSGSFTLRLTDAGNPQIGTVTKTFDVVFDEPNTNLASYALYPSAGQLGDGSGAAVYLTSDFTSLTSSIPSSTFGSQSYNPNGYNTNFYLRGLQQTMSSSVNTRSVCDPNNSGTLFPGVPPAFYNFKSSFGGLTDGAFYVYFNPRISQAYTGGSFPTVGFRYQIAYRSNSSSPWTTALDMNGQSATFSGTWRFNGSSTPAGLDVNTVSSPFNNTPQMVLVNLANSTADKYGGLVYAFNTPGEYRILHANFTSTFGALTNNPLSFPANGFTCSSPGPYVDGDMSHIFETGDFYYPSTSAGGFDDQIAPGGSDPNSVFRYRISQGSCSTTPTQNVYAREPVAKYVTQLYTDQALSTKFTSITSGTSYVIRRMADLVSVNSAFLNPEYTNQGRYTLNFQNTTGLVVVNSQTPCYY